MKETEPLHLRNVDGSGNEVETDDLVSLAYLHEPAVLHVLPRFAECMHVLRHPKHVNSVVVGSVVGGEGLLVSGGGDGVLQLHSPTTGELVQELEAKASDPPPPPVLHATLAGRRPSKAEKALINSELDRFFSRARMRGLDFHPTIVYSIYLY